jgi:hypothetical protein
MSAKSAEFYYTPIKGWTVEELENMTKQTKKIDLTKWKKIDPFIDHLHHFEEIMASINALPEQFSLPSEEAKSKASFIFASSPNDKNTSDLTMTNVYCMISGNDNTINTVKRNMKLKNCHVTMLDLIPYNIYDTINNMEKSQIAIFNGKDLINICIDCEDQILRVEGNPRITNKDEAIEALLKLKVQQI